MVKFASHTLHIVAVIIGLTVVAVEPAVAGDSSDRDSSQTQARPYPDGINCVWMPSLRSQSYSVIDDRHLVLEAVGRKFYLLTLTRHCQDLETSLDIGLDHHGDSLCGPGDSIVTGRDRCTIQYLERVENYKDGEAVVKARDAAEKAARDAARRRTD